MIVLITLRVMATVLITLRVMSIVLITLRVMVSSTCTDNSDR